MNKNNKILTLEDLENYYLKHKKSTHFNAEESGYKIAVHIPTNFEIYDNSDDTMLFVKCRVFHVGLNRNNSAVTEDAASKAMKTMAYKPLLANFTDVNGELDFTAHDMKIDSDSDDIIYEEKQIGCLTADKPWFEYDEELEKNYVCAYAAIPREYTKSADIIERKNGTKVSVELLINDMSYDSKEKYLQLNDVTVQGVTCLGTNPDTGNEVQEGMLGSKITLQDFSEENNSMFSNVEESKLIETLDKLNTTLSKFNIQANAEDKTEEGGENVKFEELLKQYNKTVEDITFEYENLSDEELEAAFAQAFAEAESQPVTSEEGETSEEFTEEVNEVEEVEETTETEIVVETKEVNEVEETEDAPVVETESEETVEAPAEETQTEETFEATEETPIEEVPVEETKNFSATIGDKKYAFALSMNAKIEALSTLVNDTYAENDNTFYSVEAYDNYVVMVDYWTGRAYKQSYKVKKDTYSLSGDRIEVYAQFLTQDEINALDQMKGNYSAIESELNQYKAAEAYADKMTVFEDKNYAQFLETEEFKALMSKDSVNALSKDELLEKAELTFAKLVKSNGTFALDEQEEKPEKKHDMFAFARIEHNTSFLDGLLKK